MSQCNVGLWSRTRHCLGSNHTACPLLLVWRMSSRPACYSDMPTQCTPLLVMRDVWKVSLLYTYLYNVHPCWWWGMSRRWTSYIDAFPVYTQLVKKSSCSMKSDLRYHSAQASKCAGKSPKIQNREYQWPHQLDLAPTKEFKITKFSKCLSNLCVFTSAKSFWSGQLYFGRSGFRTSQAICPIGVKSHFEHYNR